MIIYLYESFSKKLNKLIYQFNIFLYNTSINEIQIIIINFFKKNIEFFLFYIKI